MMKTARRIAALLMVLGALFLGGGVVLGAPAHLGVRITLVVLALLLLVGAVFVWPRPRRPWQVDALINEARR